MPNSPKHVIAAVAWLKTRGQKRHARFSIYYDFFSINKIASPACHHQWAHPKRIKSSSSFPVKREKTRGRLS